jgi:hypothetical protein
VQFRGASAGGSRSSVLLFEEPSEEVCRFLHEVGSQGAKRVIAVSLARPLRSGEVSGLLATGAADVLIWKDSEQNVLVGRIKALLDRWEVVDCLLDSGWLQQRLVGGSTCWRGRLR